MSGSVYDCGHCVPGGPFIREDLGRGSGPGLARPWQAQWAGRGSARPPGPAGTPNAATLCLPVCLTGGLPRCGAGEARPLGHTAYVVPHYVCVLSARGPALAAQPRYTAPHGPRRPRRPRPAAGVAAPASPRPVHQARQPCRLLDSCRRQVERQLRKSLPPCNKDGSPSIFKYLRSSAMSYVASRKDRTLSHAEALKCDGIAGRDEPHVVGHERGAQHVRLSVCHHGESVGLSSPRDVCVQPVQRGRCVVGVAPSSCGPRADRPL